MLDIQEIGYDFTELPLHPEKNTAKRPSKQDCKKVGLPESQLLQREIKIYE